MKKTTIALAIAVLILAADVASAESLGSQTLSGTYDWSDGNVGKLIAEFKPDRRGNLDGEVRFQLETVKTTLGPERRRAPWRTGPR